MYWIGLGLLTAGLYWLWRPKKVIKDTYSGQEQWFNINGNHLNFVHFNQPGKPTIVFIHGLGGQLRQFAPQLEHFKQGFSVLAFEFVGHGHSKVSQDPKQYHAESILRDALALIRHFVKGDLLLVCHSYGCTIGALAAKELKPKAIVYLGPKSKLTDKQRKTMQGLPKVPTLLFDLFRFFDQMGGLNSSSIKRAVGPNCPTSVKRTQMQFNRTTPSMVFQYTAGYATDGTPQDFDLNIPAFVVGGKHDIVCPPDVDVEDVKNWAKIPQDRVTLLETGHILMLEDPDGVNGVVEQAIKAAGF
ncbi:Alpha/Beta hydrolase protein [Gorgonomyces haynaldii]|nr:Alpha/Beta hydrolase protein [Gorgonomyces haynaldii]